MKKLRRFAAAVIGTVFFMAGLFKMMDPVGSSLVMSAYFKFLHIGFLDPAATVTADVLSLFETVLGAALITGVWRNVMALVTACTLGFFTLLTLALWIINPEMDCGCFGQVLHLEHYQSFLKNVILDLLWLLAFIPMPKDRPRKSKYAAFGIAALSAVAFLVYSSLSIPMMDFTPYSSGTEIGVEDGGHEYASLSFFDADWNYADSLALEGKVMIISTYNPENLSPAQIAGIGAFRAEAVASGFTSLLLTAAMPGPGEEGKYCADRKTLMTLNRSNGGATMLNDGQIVAKWSLLGLPDTSKLEDLAAEPAAEIIMKENTPRRLWLQGFLLYVFAVMLLL